MEEQKEEKVVLMKKHKRQRKMPNFPVKKVLIGGAACLILAVLIIAGTCQIKEIKIDGLDSYTEAEVKKAVRENGYLGNSVAYFIKCKLSPPDLLPFIDSMSAELVSPNKIRIHIKEKKRAGCLEYNGKYVYFDKNGYALESYEKRYDDVPLVTGLKYNELVMQEKIPVKKKEIFSYLLELTMTIDKYQLPIDQIHIESDGNALLKSGDLTIDLANRKDIDLKIPELSGILKKLKGKSGTIDMKYFDEDQKITLFRPKKS